MQQNSDKQFSIAQIGIALLFLFIAVSVLFEVIGWIKTETIFGQYWPILLIFIGILTIQPKQPRGNSFSFGLTSIGLLLLLRNMGIFNSQNSRIVLVILLLLCGIAVLAMTTSRQSSEKNLHD